jgi:hypothetical protein
LVPTLAFFLGEASVDSSLLIFRLLAEEEFILDVLSEVSIGFDWTTKSPRMGSIFAKYPTISSRWFVAIDACFPFLISIEITANNETITFYLIEANRERNLIKKV